MANEKYFKENGARGRSNPIRYLEMWYYLCWFNGKSRVEVSLDSVFLNCVLSIYRSGNWWVVSQIKYDFALRIMWGVWWIRSEYMVLASHIPDQSFNIEIMHSLFLSVAQPYKLYFLYSNDGWVKNCAFRRDCILKLHLFFLFAIYFISIIVRWTLALYIHNINYLNTEK